MLAATPSRVPRPPRRSRAPTRSCTCSASRSPSAGATRPSARFVTRACSARGSLVAASAALDAERRPAGAGLAVGDGLLRAHGDEPLDESTPAGHDFLAGVVRELGARGRGGGDAGVRVALHAHRRRALSQRRRAGQDAAAVQARRRGAGRRRAPVRPVDPPRRRGRRACWTASTTTGAGAGQRDGAAPVTNAELSRALGRVLHRPAVLPVPGVRAQAAVRRDGGDRGHRPAGDPAQARAARLHVPLPRARAGAARRPRAADGFATCCCGFAATCGSPTIPRWPRRARPADSWCRCSASIRRCWTAVTAPGRARSSARVPARSRRLAARARQPAGGPPGAARARAAGARPGARRATSVHVTRRRRARSPGAATARARRAREAELELLSSPRAVRASTIRPRSAPGGAPVHGVHPVSPRVVAGAAPRRRSAGPARSPPPPSQARAGTDPVAG